jgi:hypothetical protein
MAFYNIVYYRDSKRYNEDIEANSYQDALKFFDKFVQGYIVEVSEIVYENKFYPKDDADSIKSVSCYMQNEDNLGNSIKIPKVKKSIEDNILKAKILDTFKVKNKPVKTLKLTYNF